VAPIHLRKCATAKKPYSQVGNSTQQMLNEWQLYRQITGTVNQHSMGLYKLLFVINSFKIN